MTEKLVNSISGRLSLRRPLTESLEILSRITDIISLDKDADLQERCSIIQSEFPSVADFERNFPSLCFAIATGVGKTRLMGAFISYLHLSKHINNFFVLAPNLTIYNKLIDDFTPNTPKYVFNGLSEFIVDPPLIITGDNYESGIDVRSNQLIFTGIHINIFNISKINTEVRGGNAPRIKRLSEYIGQSYFEYLAALPDLVLLMDESHRYRASAGLKALNELNPILGLELTATPFTESTKGPVFFKNIIYEYPLSKAMEDGYVKEPAVVTQKNFIASQFTQEQLERIKLEDAIRIHEATKVELETYARQNGKNIVKPFILVIARDTTHAAELKKLIESGDFFNGAYKGKVIQVDSSQRGEEKEENVERLLSVEKNDEPTEIVIHVNMLKEGWDVTNLYTIVPLRAANARTLVEQSIGRGLRLPYGKRTGVTTIDRLNIIAHDHFQEIVDEANRPDSQVHIKAVFIDKDADSQKLKTVVTPSSFSLKLQPTSSNANRAVADSVTPMFNKPAEQKFAQAVVAAIQSRDSSPSLTYAVSDDTMESIVAEAQGIYSSEQNDLPGIEEEIDYRKIAEETARVMIAGTIDIPRILVIPKNNTNISYGSFKLDCSGIRYQPVSRDLLIQHLRTNNQEVLSSIKEYAVEERLEDYLVRGLIDYEDISYDDQSDLLYDLSAQLIKHLETYLKTFEDTRNVVLFHQKQLADFIHAQMLDHQIEAASEFDIKISKGFTPLKEIAFTAEEGTEPLNFRNTSFDKSKIGKIIFNGFFKCLYPAMKFDSDTERRFSVILEQDSIKWLKPAKGQFQIHYRMGNSYSEYVPDFVAETSDCIYMIETKAKNELSSPEVLSKQDAAVEWCKIATDYNADIGKKPWIYLLIPHDEVKDNMTLISFRRSK
ncbi:DEAD/DEAH box helicase [Treponema primitia]|uniref:DEAD/DEAH box helicase n=1 Tax=Treponema primitia TaxID=88058 RepID=UPI0002554DCB|nr:DEAD/DEAH box helicase family protein [Treponema primitia]